MIQITYGKKRLRESPAVYAAGTKTNEMGQVTTTLTIINYVDEELAARGMLPAEQVRSITLEGVVADTGATLLCLPKSMIDRLGLRVSHTVLATTATGVSEARIFNGAKIVLQDRSTTQDVMELPGGSDPLLGVVPMEALGVQLDLKKQSLKLLSVDGVDTFYTIY
jgi:predicted aspartyl protease